MGKKHRHRHRESRTIETPSFESPVCPTCGWDTQLEQAEGDKDTPLITCKKCKVRFMYEDISMDGEGDDEEETVEIETSKGVRVIVPVSTLKCPICKGGGCTVCLPSKKDKGKDKPPPPPPDYQTEPQFGKMEEVTDGPRT